MRRRRISVWWHQTRVALAPKIKDPSNARFHTSSSLTPYHNKDMWLVCGGGGGVLDMLWCHGERSASIVKNQLFSRLPSGSRERNKVPCDFQQFCYTAVEFFKKPSIFFFCLKMSPSHQKIL